MNTPLFSRLGTLLLGALCLAALAPSPATAADYPDKPVRLVVPFPAGGGADTLARLIMPRVGQASLTVPVSVGRSSTVRNSSTVTLGGTLSDRV